MLLMRRLRAIMASSVRASSAPRYSLPARNVARAAMTAAVGVIKRVIAAAVNSMGSSKPRMCAASPKANSV